MARGSYLILGGVAYLVFFATFLYLIGFLANLPGLPSTVDIGPETPAVGAAIVDSALIALFGLQHSVMARRGFKSAWIAVVPAPIERSVYVIFSSLALILLYLAWRPLPAIIWSVSDPVAVGVLWALFALGWAMVLLSTFLLNHFELFGLSQVWRNLRGRAADPPQFREPFFYKLVRHPLYTGFIIAFWAAPVMTVGHLLFAGGMTAYVLIAIRHEERDLVGLFGRDYEDYRARVGMLTPRLRRG